MEIKTRTSYTDLGFKSLMLEVCEEKLAQTSDQSDMYEALLDLMRSLLYTQIIIKKED